MQVKRTGYYSLHRPGWQRASLNDDGVLRGVWGPSHRQASRGPASLEAGSPGDHHLGSQSHKCPVGLSVLAAALFTSVCRSGDLTLTLDFNMYLSIYLSYFAHGFWGSTTRYFYSSHRPYCVLLCLSSQRMIGDAITRRQMKSQLTLLIETIYNSQRNSSWRK